MKADCVSSYSVDELLEEDAVVALLSQKAPSRHNAGVEANSCQYPSSDAIVLYIGNDRFVGCIEEDAGKARA